MSPRPRRHARLCSLPRLLLLLTVTVAVYLVYLASKLEPPTSSTQLRGPLDANPIPNPNPNANSIQSSTHNGPPTTRSPPTLVHYTAKERQTMPSWVDINGPRIQLRYYSDADGDAFVAQHRPMFYETYLTLSRIERTDYLRYLVVYVLGGVYVDADVEAVLPVDDWLRAFHVDDHALKLQDLDFVVGLEILTPRLHYAITGALPFQLAQFAFAGRKGSRVLKAIVELVEKTVKDVSATDPRVGRQDDLVLQRTGPAVFSQAILDEIRRFARPSTVPEWATRTKPVEQTDEEAEVMVKLYPKALLPMELLNGNGQVVKLVYDDDKSNKQEQVTMMVLPYRAFSFHPIYDLGNNPVLAKHLFHGSWRTHNWLYGLLSKLGQVVKLVY